MVSKTRSGKIYSKQNNNIVKKEDISIYYTITIDYIDDKVERMIPIKHKKNDIKRTYNTRSTSK
tara:strand:- start:71 stop:262 length:192 start_codon:yes stop_codon:yes gene_type:complete